MSRLAELIAQLCPDGVEYRALGDVGVFVRGGGLQKADFVGTGMPCVHYGQIHTRFGISTSEAVTFVSETQFARLKHADYGDLLIATTSEDDEAVGKATAWLGDGEVAISGDMLYYRHNLEPKYVSYFFASSSFQEQKRPYLTGAKVRRIADKGLSRIRIPVPPVEVQREIVRILDQFTTLEAELEAELDAELEARRTQYEHYRNHLLSYESLAARGPVEMVKLGAVSWISAGYGFPKSEQGHSSGEYPFYKVSDMNRPGNQVFLEGAANYLAGPDIRRLKIVPFPAGAIVFPKIGAAIATNKKRILSCPSLVDNNVAVCVPEGIDGKYLYYWFLEQDLRVVAHDSGAVPSIRKTDLEQLDVPVPSVAEQERIVEVLDRFNALVNDITSGLPAEIAARRAQYEHYRDRLLSFPEKVVSVSDAS